MPYAPYVPSAPFMPYAPYVPSAPFMPYAPYVPFMLFMPYAPSGLRKPHLLYHILTVNINH
jgi:hypothetical protein